jgi:hypothetical protein
MKAKNTICAQNPECLHTKSSERHLYVLLLTILIVHVNKGKFLKKVHILED